MYINRNLHLCYQVTPYENSIIHFHALDESEILMDFKRFKDEMIAGPDGILSFNIPSIMEGTEETKVCPVFKTRDKSNISNYSSGSLLCNF